MPKFSRNECEEAYYEYLEQEEYKIMVDYVNKTHFKVFDMEEFNFPIFNVLPTEYDGEYISTTIEIRVISNDINVISNDIISFNITNYYNYDNYYTIKKNINDNLVFTIVKNDNYCVDNVRISMFNDEMKNLYNFIDCIEELRKMIINNYLIPNNQIVIDHFQYYKNIGCCLFLPPHIFNKNLKFIIRDLSIIFFPYLIPGTFGYLRVTLDNTYSNGCIENIPKKFRNVFCVKINDIENLFDNINYIQNYPIFEMRKNYIRLHHEAKNIFDNNSNISNFICNEFWTRELMEYL